MKILGGKFSNVNSSNFAAEKKKFLEKSGGARFSSNFRDCPIRMWRTLFASKKIYASDPLFPLQPSHLK
jgi:hypothetical protein